MVHQFLGASEAARYWHATGTFERGFLLALMLGESPNASLDAFTPARF